MSAKGYITGNEAADRILRGEVHRSEALLELADAIEAWAAGEGKFPGHRLDTALKRARVVLAALAEPVA